MEIRVIIVSGREVLNLENLWSGEGVTCDLLIKSPATPTNSLARGLPDQIGI